jgi:hypothetical protein
MKVIMIELETGLIQTPDPKIITLHVYLMAVKYYGRSVKVKLLATVRTFEFASLRAALTLSE